MQLKKLIAILMTTTSVFGFNKNEELEKDSLHHFYIQPELSWSVPDKLTYNLNDQDAKTIEFSTGQYYGINFGYEFTEPNTIYFGLQSLLLSGNRTFEVIDAKDEERGKGAVGQLEEIQHRVESVIGYNI